MTSRDNDDDDDVDDDDRNDGAFSRPEHDNVNVAYMAEPGAARPTSSNNTQSNTTQDALRTTPSAGPQAARVAAQAAPTHNSVMHETLSVIDEHITDLRSPRHSRVSARRGGNHDADSIYGSQAGNRLSYINGRETDDEEDQQHLHTEAEVMAWTPARVAEYLEDHGVETAHCQVFREQDITGEVILEMEQSAIFIKEFELGSVGRRLKTWQKVKLLQDEVRSAAPPTIPRSVSDYSVAGDDAMSDIGRARSASVNTTSMRPISAVGAMSGYSAFADRPENTARPSAASIRSLNHSRRHSSVGSLDANMAPASARLSHQRQLSTSALAAASAAARRRSSVQDQNLSLTPPQFQGPMAANHGLGSLPSPADLDRGYFSGNELDNRHKRNVLQKRSSPAHTRNVSAVTDSARHSAHFKAHGRMASTESMRDEPVSPILSPASGLFAFNRNPTSRAVSSPQFPAKPLTGIQGPASPIVTKLEYGNSSFLAESDTSSMNPSPSPASHNFSFFSKPRIGGLRIASDAITQNEKRAQSTLKGSPITSPPRTGSTTPSTDTRSFELHKPDTQSRVSTGSSNALAPPPPPLSARARPKPKTKKSTSAYTRGLERKTPAEQMAGCDYSGWMKKKSSNLMGSWKPRLFVLRGRRLSYYYSENDTEEKGLIDISSHRVLPAENERMTGIHAALTGATSSPIMPSSAMTQTSAATDLATNPLEASDQGLFIFKLVPPRQGLSKAVNFTKPAVHYFAVNSRQEGRLWMAALMKATIDYDSNGKVITSYSQKTISLATARARNERPPALRDVNGEIADRKTLLAELEGAPIEETTVSDGNTGLGIGLAASSFDESRGATAGADRDVDGSTAMPLPRLAD